LEILSDELNAIVPTNDGAMVIAMPFAGDFGRARADARAVPLRAIYRLVQAPVARVEPLRTAEQVAYLAGSCPFLNGDPLGAEMVLSNAETLVARVPVKTLAFPKDARAWRAIQSDVGLA
ncbi:MAG: hypothetical protein KC417_17675, partial [Myxococcales bacterium]|nr:hypothetical protein [Myxococcales bacterium]